jgi:hypothetical protein
VSFFSEIAPLGAPFGFRLLDPLSAQAHGPGRPSGADKEQNPKQEGSIRPGRCSPPSDRADIAPHRHAVTLVAGVSRWIADTITVEPGAPFLAEMGAAGQAVWG